MSTKQSKQEKTAGVSGSKANPQAAAAAAPSKIGSLIRYFEDSRTELGKVSWPTKKEVRITSIAVLVLVVIMSIFLGLVDMIFAGLIEVILNIGA